MKKGDITELQKKRFNSYYEQKFRKFYFKFLFHTGNVKERLLDCFDDFEYAYSLSQVEGIPIGVQAQWQTIWEELLAKPLQTDYRPLYFSCQNTIHRKHYKTMEKYILFFYEEYNRIDEKRKIFRNSNT